MGCGKGDIAIPLASLGYQIIGVDVFPAVIETAKFRKTKLLNQDNSVEFLVGDAESLNIRNQLFDFIICTEVLEHLEHPEKALDSIFSLLKKNGTLIVTIPNGYGPYSLFFNSFTTKIAYAIARKIQHSPHVQAFTFSRFQKLIEERGFRIFEVGHSDFISFLPFLVNLKGFCKIDCAIADRLPSPFVGGWFLACRKRNEAL